MNDLNLNIPINDDEELAFCFALLSGWTDFHRDSNGFLLGTDPKEQIRHINRVHFDESQKQYQIEVLSSLGFALLQPSKEITHE